MFICFAILAFIFMMFVKYTNSRDKHKSEDFLERESKANSTRKQSLDNLDYITIPIDSLPFYENATGEILRCQNVILSLSEKHIVNLSGKTNTDLKLEYGAANLPALTEYDNNFAELTGTIVKWAAALTDEGHEEDAVRVLEYGIQCNTDVSSNYLILADYYASKGDIRKIRTLRTRAMLLHTLMKDKIISKLDDLISGLSQI